MPLPREFVPGVLVVDSQTKEVARVVGIDSKHETLKMVYLDTTLGHVHTRMAEWFDVLDHDRFGVNQEG